MGWHPPSKVNLASDSLDNGARLRYNLTTMTTTSTKRSPEDPRRRHREGGTVSDQKGDAPVAEVTPAKTQRAAIVGKTSKEFDGIGVGTLRAWHRYWSNETRSKDDPALESRPREVHLEMIAAELKERGKPVA